MYLWTDCHRLPVSWIVAGMFVVCGGNLLAPSTARGDAATDGVIAATKAYEEAFNTGAADRFTQFWAVDADYTTTDGDIYRGRDAIRELIAAEAEELKGSKLKFTEITNRTLKPEVVIQDGVLEFSTSAGLVDRSRYTAVWVQTDGTWQLSSVRDLGPLPAVAVPEVVENPLLGLEAFRGEWTSENEVASVKLAVDWKLGNQFLQFDYVVTPQEGSPFTILQLVGWDPADEVVRSWFFDSTGGHGSGVWDKTETGWTALSSGVTPTGQVGGGVYNYQVQGSTMTLKITDREVAGRAIPDTEVKFTRPAAESK